MSETTKSACSRPGRNDPKVVAMHMARILGRVREYLIGKGDASPDMDEVMQQVESAMQYEEDGYRIAKYLDDLGWDADADLVELMDQLGCARHDAHQQATRAWVADEQIRPLFAMGQQVEFTQRQQRLSGEITKIDHQHAKYLVFVASLGHVRNGIGTLGTFVPFEDVQPASEPAAVSP